jgi:hypothetical protein
MTRATSSFTVSTGLRVRMVKSPMTLSRLQVRGYPSDVGVQRLSAVLRVEFSAERETNPSMSVPAGS